MLRLIKWAVTLALIWSVYWVVASMSMQRGLNAWFDTQKARGWQADFADIDTQGFPWRHVTRLDAPALADPATGTAWSAEWLEFDNPAIWPGRQTLRFPETPQRLSYFDQTATIVVRDGVARLHLDPGLALALDQLSLTTGPWEVARDGQPLAAADNLQVGMTQTDVPETYRFHILADGFTPGMESRRLLLSSGGLPQSFETLKLDMSVRFDRVWDRRALEERRPQPRRIKLALLDAHWGAMRLQMAGDVEVDGAGLPTGSVTIRAEKWREMLAFAQRSGVLPAQVVSPFERTLDILAGLGGNPDALDVTLSLRNGQVALGPVPLGPAPRFLLR